MEGEIVETGVVGMGVFLFLFLNKLGSHSVLRSTNVHDV